MLVAWWNELISGRIDTSFHAVLVNHRLEYALTQHYINADGH